MEQLQCVTCKKRISLGASQFQCPKCGKSKIIRCLNCRETAARYDCPECKFSGPN